MRLLKYFSYSGLDEQTNKFRCMRIGLVKNPEQKNELHDIINYVKEKYNLDDDVMRLVEYLNLRLKSYYKGQYKFDFILKDEIDIKDIKMYNRLENRIKLLLFESNDKLAKIKQKIESK